MWFNLCVSDIFLKKIDVQSFADINYHPFNAFPFLYTTCNLTKQWIISIFLEFQMKNCVCRFVVGLIRKYFLLGHFETHFRVLVLIQTVESFSWVSCWNVEYPYRNSNMVSSWVYNMSNTSCVRNWVLNWCKNSGRFCKKTVCFQNSIWFRSFRVVLEVIVFVLAVELLILLLVFTGGIFKGITEIRWEPKNCLE